MPAVQDPPVLRRRVSKTGLECGWAQGNVWHDRSAPYSRRVNFVLRKACGAFIRNGSTVYDAAVPDLKYQLMLVAHEYS